MRNKDFRITIRLSPDENNQLTKDYITSGYKNKSKYIKSKLFSNINISSNNDRILLAHTLRNINICIDNLYDEINLIHDENNNSSFRELKNSINNLIAEVKELNGNF